MPAPPENDRTQQFDPHFPGERFSSQGEKRMILIFIIDNHNTVQKIVHTELYIVHGMTRGLCGPDCSYVALSSSCTPAAGTFELLMISKQKSASADSWPVTKLSDMNFYAMAVLACTHDH